MMKGKAMAEVEVENTVQNASPGAESPTAAPLEISDLLVEDVSIDGMCGVY